MIRETAFQRARRTAEGGGEVGRRATWEVARVPAPTNAAGAVERFTVTPTARSLLVVNPLHAPIYIAFRQGPDPSATSFDFVCPAQSMLSVPVVGPRAMLSVDALALAVYPEWGVGETPASDTGRVAIIFASEELLRAGVTSMASAAGTRPQDSEPLTVGSRLVHLGVVPTLDVAAYAPGDVLATAILTFAGAVRDTGGFSGTVVGLVVIDRDLQQAPGELWLFSASVTPAAANAAHSVADAAIADLIGVISFGPYYATALNAVSVNHGIAIPFVAANGVADIFGILVTRGAPTYTVNGLTIALVIAQD